MNKIIFSLIVAVALLASRQNDAESFFNKTRGRGYAKPQAGATINWSDPINSGLSCAWVMTEEGGKRLRDAASVKHGTLVNGTAWDVGVFGGALKFDGVDDYVETGVLSSNFLTASSGTISLWIFPTGSAPVHTVAYRGGIIGDGSGYLSIARASIGGDDKIWAYNWDVNEDRVGTTYTVGVWTHFVWVHSGGYIYLYKNGVLAGSVASGDTGSLGYDFFMGNVVPSVGVYSYFDGKIDAVRVYKRALTANEIKRLYEEPFAGVSFSGAGFRRAPSGDGAPAATTGNFFSVLW